MQDTDVFVSVIIPTRNRCALLRRAVASVQEQTHVRWEILVIDDGSDDGTADMLAGLNDDRIHFFRAADDSGSGSGNARWRGVHHARGDYIAYLDSDDYWLPHKLERQLASAQDCPHADVVVLGPPLTLRNGELFESTQPPLRARESIPDYIYTGARSALQTSCFLVSGELGRRVRFAPDLRVNQDTDFLLRLAAAGAYFLYLDEHLHVQDSNPRGDRISVNRALLQDSLAWFHAVSGDWSTAARRGYYFADLSIRYANQGQVLAGLWYFFRGVDVRRSPYQLVQQLLRVLGRGDVPRSIRRLGRWTGISRGRRAS